MSRLSIRTGIKLDSISSIKKEIQSQLDKVSSGLNIKLGKIDINNIESEIEKIKSKLNTLNNNQTKIKPEFDSSTANRNLNDYINNIKNKTREALGETAKLSKINVKTDNQGNFLGATVTSINNANQKVLKFNSDLKLIGQSYTQNDAKAAKAMQNQNNYLDSTIQKLENYKKKLNESKDIKTTDKRENLSSDIDRQIAKMNELKNSNQQLSATEKARINSTTTALRQQTSELTRQQTTMSGLIKQMASYAGVGTLMYAGINQLKSGIRDIVSLDTAMRDLKRVSDDVSNESLKNFTSQANEMAIALGNSTEGVINATTTFKQLGYSFKEANEFMAQNALVLSNVGDMSAGDSANSIVSILKGFRKEASETTNIVDILNETGNKYAITTGQVTEGLRVSAAALAVANNSLEESTALITAGTEVLRDPNAIGVGLKTISMRLRGISEDGEQLSWSMRDLIKETTAVGGQAGIDIENANGTLKSTYQIIKELGEVWDELGDKQKSLLLEEIAGKHQSKTLASILQNAEKLEEVYETANNAAGSAAREQAAYMDSIEGRANAFRETLKKVWIDSISTDTVKDIVSLGTSVLEVFDVMVQKFGLIPSVIGAATFALSLFNKEFYNGLVKNIPFLGSLNQSFNKFFGGIQNVIGDKLINAFTNYAAGLSSARAQTEVLKVGNMALSASLKAVEVAAGLANAALTLGMSFLISAGISAITKFADKLITTKEELREMNQEMSDFAKQSQGNVGKVESMLKEINSLESQLAQAGSNDQRAKIESEILDKRKQIADIYPMAVSYIDEEGNMIASNNSLIREQLELEKEKASLKALEFMENNKNLTSEIQGLAEKKRMYNEMKIAYTRGEKYTQKKEVVDPYSGDRYTREVEVKVKKDDLEKLNQEIVDTTTKMSQLKIMYASLSEADRNSEFGQSLVQAMQECDNYTRELEANSNAANNNKYANDDAANGIDGVGNAADQATSKIKGMSDAFANTNNTIELLKGALDEFQNNGFLSAGTFEKFFATGDTKLISLLGDVDNFERNINTLLQQQENQRLNIRDSIIQQAIAAEQASAVETNNQINSENVKTQATINGANDRNNAIFGEVDNNSQAYGNDAINKINSENAKGTAVANGSNQRANMVGQEVNNNASAYGVDTTNQANSENNKVSNTSLAINSITGMIAGGLSSLGSVYATDAANYAGSLNAKLTSTQSFVNQTNRMLGSIQTVNNPLANAKPGETRVDTINRGINELNSMSGKPMGPVNDGYKPVSAGKISSNFKPVAIGTPSSGKSGGGSGKKGSSGSKSKGSGSSSSNKVDIKDTEVKIDRYKQLQDAIDDVNNALDKNKTLQEQANGRDKIKYMNEEVSLLKKKKEELKAIEKEMQKEAKELENQLRKQGLNAKNGDITNYVSKLEAQKKKVNSMSNSDKNKENEIKKLEELIKTADRYFDLTSNELPKIQNQWLEINSTIKQQRKEYMSLIRSSEEEVFNMIKDKIDKRKEEYEKETDKLKEEISKRKEAMNKQYQDEDYQKNLKNKQEELSKLELQIEEAARNTSKQGQLALEELLKQKKELQDELNQMIKDQQRDEANDLFDKEMDDLDKDLENKLESLDKEFSNEKIAQMVKTLISTGFIEIEGEVIKLQQAMKDFYVSQGEVFSDSSMKMQEFIDQLETVKNLYGELSSINADLGIKNGTNVSSYAANSRMIVPNLNLPNLPGVQGRSAEGISMPITLTVEGNVTDDALPKLERMLVDTEKRIYKTLNKKFG